MVVFNEVHNQHLQTSVGIVSVLTELKQEITFHNSSNFKDSIRKRLQPDSKESYKYRLDEVNYLRMNFQRLFNISKEYNLNILKQGLSS